MMDNEAWLMIVYVAGIIPAMILNAIAEIKYGSKYSSDDEIINGSAIAGFVWPFLVGLVVFLFILDNFSKLIYFIPSFVVKNFRKKD